MSACYLINTYTVHAQAHLSVYFHNVTIACKSDCMSSVLLVVTQFCLLEDLMTVNLFRVICALYK